METFQFPLYNTYNLIRSDLPADALASSLDLAKRYELLFSRTDPASELFRVNAQAGSTVAVSPQLAELTSSALGYCGESGGLFDITMGAAVRLWDFNAGTVPDPESLASVLRHVDYRAVTCSDATIRLEDPEASIDLGGIAKGYIADGLLDWLERAGGCHSLVNLGGNVAVRGGKEDGSPWKIGLRRPASSLESPSQNSFAVIEIDSGSVVTSGVYERAFERGGRVYHHILDPRDGMPARTDVVSASVVSRRSLDGDGYSTALILMGADRALQFAETHPRIEAVLVTDEGDVLATSGIGRDYAFRML